MARSVGGVFALLFDRWDFIRLRFGAYELSGFSSEISPASVAVIVAPVGVLLFRCIFQNLCILGISFSKILGNAVIFSSKALKTIPLFPLCFRLKFWDWFGSRGFWLIDGWCLLVTRQEAAISSTKIITKTICKTHWHFFGFVSQQFLKFLRLKGTKTYSSWRGWIPNFAKSLRSFSSWNSCGVRLV